MPPVLLLVAAGCKASFPTEPTEPAALTSIVIHFDGVVGPLTPRVARSMRAFTITTDRIFYDVTQQAVWMSSDPGVVEVRPGTIVGVSPGAAIVSVTHQGLTHAIAIVVDPLFPYPSLRLTAGGPHYPGERWQWDAWLATSPDRSAENVTHAAAWSSSDSRVATVAAGHVTAVGAGTTAIVAAYGGLSVTYYLSVYPGVR